MSSSLGTPIYLSATQIDVIRGLFAGSAMLSIAGSSAILYRLVKGKQLAKKPFERLVFGLSVADLMMSTQNVIFPIFFYPFREPSVACSMDGFMSSLSYMGPYYNCSLSFYYLLVLVYGVKDSRLKRVYEPIMHGVSIALPILAAILGVSLQVFNPLEFSISCWSNTYPNGCDGDECKRGDPWVTFIFGIVFGAFPIGAALVILIVNSAIIFCYMRKIENKARRHRLRSRSNRRLPLSHHSRGTPGSVEQLSRESRLSSVVSVESQRNLNPPAMEDASSSIVRRQARPKISSKQSVQVAHQSFAWVLAFFLSFISITALFLASASDPEAFKTDKYNWLQMMNALLIPMQGFFNVLVYIRPRYLRWRRQTEFRRIPCFYKAMFTFESPPRRRSQGISSMPQPESRLSNLISSSHAGVPSAALMSRVDHDLDSGEENAPLEEHLS